MNGRLPRWAPPARWPLAAWIALAVTVGHLLLFWLVADKHFLPKIPPAPAPQPPIFSARAHREIDLLTGKITVRREFTVSTRLPTPTPSAAAPANKADGVDKSR